MTDLRARTLTGVLDEPTAERIARASNAMRGDGRFIDASIAIQVSAILDLLADGFGRPVVRSALERVCDDIEKRQVPE